MTLIPPYDHPDVIAARARRPRNCSRKPGQLDVLLVLPGRRRPAGRLARWRRAALSPSCKVIGVEPEAGNDGQQSLRSGEIVHIAVPDTIADGAKVTHIGDHNFEVIRRHGGRHRHRLATRSWCRP